MKSCRDCPFKAEAYQNLNREEYALIDSHRHEVRYVPGEIIIKQGTACTHVLSFVNGLAKMYIEAPHGENLVIRLVKPHEFIVGTGLFPEDRHNFSVMAVEPSMVCFIDVSVIRELIGRNGKFAISLLSHFQQNITFTLERLASFYTKHHIGRLAESLLYLMENIYDKNPFELSLSRKDLAGLAGISKENAQRLMKNLETDGIIRVNGKSIKVLDREKLSQISVNG